MLKRKSGNPSFISIVLGGLICLSIAGSSYGAPIEGRACSKDEEKWSRVVSNILGHYFNPPPGRRIVVVYDKEKAVLAGRLLRELASRGHGGEGLFIANAADTSLEAFRKVLEDDRIGLMVLASPRMFRGLKLYERLDFSEFIPSLRCAASPVFFDTVLPLESLLRVYLADPTEIEDFLSDLRRKLPIRSRMHMVAPGGTSLSFVSRDWKEWPWEVATYPVEESVDGTIVVDGAVFFREVRDPIRIRIRKGKLVEIACLKAGDEVCERYVREMNRAGESDPLNWQLAEVGIGGNPRAELSESVMESESVRGTAHFCFGNNVDFGGATSTSWHGGTVVIEQPTLYLQAGDLFPEKIEPGREGGRSLRPGRCWELVSPSTFCAIEISAGRSSDRSKK